jgi:hypothetical protein
VGQVVGEFRQQVLAYAHHEYPFNELLIGDDPLAWWEALENHRHARVLVVRYSHVIIVNYFSHVS